MHFSEKFCLNENSIQYHVSGDFRRQCMNSGRLEQPKGDNLFLHFPGSRGLNLTFEWYHWIHNEKLHRISTEKSTSPQNEILENSDGILFV